MPEYGIKRRESHMGCRGYDPYQFLLPKGRPPTAEEKVKHQLWQTYIEQTNNLRQQMLMGIISMTEYSQQVEQFRNALVASSAALTLGQFRVRLMK